MVESYEIKAIRHVCTSGGASISIGKNGGESIVPSFLSSDEHCFLPKITVFNSDDRDAGVP